MFELLLKHLKQTLNTLWNEEMIKIKVLDLDELYNFYIHHLYSWNHCLHQNLGEEHENSKASKIMPIKESIA